MSEQTIYSWRQHFAGLESSDVKKLTQPVRLAMVRNRRTIANFIEVLVREQCNRLGIGIGLVLTTQPSSR